MGVEAAKKNLNTLECLIGVYHIPNHAWSGRISLDAECKEVWATENSERVCLLSYCSP